MIFGQNCLKIAIAQQSRQNSGSAQGTVRDTVRFHDLCLREINGCWISLQFIKNSAIILFGSSGIFFVPIQLKK